ncbi:GntR family transcriptional regulator [Saccharopolyspora sp. NFXS83]|uniref:GntR family transcriptional regulator n=1 Tax=Saccharopolyspora sp. NFXS83 TaxID=2993560 RepID=UPI00224A5E68|nr:GntR family transcriptional regulator [Saccharopolyspora sp. NFXS83]MCX2729753.1 GntR family transcriptional regulator [Saccharopolyspora sp. NFXS83]
MSQAATRAYSDLRQAILTGARPAGTRLREEELAETFGLSRTPVREALRRLEADGLVRLVPHRGAEVVRFEDEDVDELFDLRCLLESHAARRAAERGDTDVAALRELCEQMEHLLHDLDDSGYEQITRLNMEFHRAVHRAGGRRLLPDLLSRVIDVPLVRRTFHQYTAAELDRSFAQHRELVDAIAAGDGDWANAVMQSHLRAARSSLGRTPPGGTSAPEHDAESPVQRTPDERQGQ